MADIFLFDGGFYKRGEDDGRLRVPLKPGLESQTIQYDPELQIDAPNAFGGTLPMAKYADIFGGLAVGDSIYIHLIPDAINVRGWWFLPQESLNGMTADFDLVSIEEVSMAIDGGALGSTVAGYMPTQAVDFSNGLGDASYDAHLQSGMNGDTFLDYRNPAAMQGGNYATPKMLMIGEAAYIRLTITALPVAAEEDGCGSSCNSCGSEVNWPTIQYGILGDRLCIAKNLVKNYCSCNAPICAGCDSSESKYKAD